MEQYEEVEGAEVAEEGAEGAEVEAVQEEEYVEVEVSTEEEIVEEVKVGMCLGAWEACAWGGRGHGGVGGMWMGQWPW